jgi:DNA-binding SARP family transcriptional activator
VDTPILRIRILGELDLRLDDVPLPPLESGRAESLLVYLLVHRGTRLPRQHLAFLLWPDSSEPQARTNLRHVLHTLRRTFPAADQFLDVTARTLEWRHDAPYWLDLAAFEAALDRGDEREAVELYRGELLAGGYDEWLRDARERLRERYLEALSRLCARLEADGERAEAISYAERLLREDPLREESYRLLMRLHDARADRARALRVYHACAAVLERELGVEPSTATRAAYEALLPGAPESASERPVLVGRAAERARLTEIWRDAARGHAQLVLVTGEAGVGKTRLVEELRSWCAHRGAATAEARSYPAEGALAYGPVVAWLRSEPLAARRVRLDRGRLAELARVLPEVSGLPRPEPLPADEQRQRLFDALSHALLAPAGPLLLVADDLHWADHETLQLLHYAVRARPEAPLLVAATARREDMDRLGELVTGLAAIERFVQIELERLSLQETAVLAERFAGRPLDAPAAARLFAETEGNPLFVVEALRAGWPGGSLSPRVQAVIEARLAALSAPARELAGVAATVGREFTADVLARCGETSEAALVSALDELWRRRIIREHGPDAYDFSHDKIREVAYRALGPARRRRTHLLVARALEALHADEPGQVAWHYDRAGAGQRAEGWYERAADRAQRMHAAHEAIRLLERALELTSDPERELALVTALTPLVANVEGFGSARVAELQQRALELARDVGVEPAAPLLRSLALMSLSKSDFEGSRRCGRLLRARGERDHDDVLLVESDYVLGISAFWQGALEAARSHFEAAIARYRPEHRATHVFRYGFDPKVVCMSRLANTLAFLGEPGAARRTRDEALAVAEETGHAASTATALVFAGILAVDLGDLDDVRRHTAALQAATREQAVRAAAVTAEALGGYVDVLDGRRDAGVARALRAADDGRDHAPGHRASIARVLLATCVAAGDARAGLDAADRLLAAGAGTALWAAEARRRRAEFLGNARGTPAHA